MDIRENRFGFSLLTQEHVDEIATRAWQNVAAHSSEYTPLEMLTSLTEVSSLSGEQLDFRAALQFLMSSEVRELVQASKRILLGMSQTTSLRTVEGRVPVGSIDWPGTITGRIVGRTDPSSFVFRQTELDRDVPENRLLRFALTAVTRLASSVLDVQPTTGWRSQVAGLQTAASSLVAHPLLTQIPAELNRHTLSAAKSSRISGYRDAARAMELYNDLFRFGDLSRLIELFREFVLIPELEERAFELLVLFRLLVRLDELGANRTSTRLLGRGRGPVFTFVLGGSAIEVYFQGTPAEISSHSYYRKVITEAGLGSSSLRPDILLRVGAGDTGAKIVVMEMKCSTNLGTIRDGVFQLIGYFGDFRLFKEDGPILFLISFGGIPESENVPIRVDFSDLTVYVSDLPRLHESLGVISG